VPDAVGRDDVKECTALLGRAAPQRLEQVQARRIDEARLDEVASQPEPMKLNLAVRPSSDDDVDALTFVGGEKPAGPRPAQERGQFRHGQYNTAIVVAAIGVAAITVALGRFNGGEGN
jgi:hypothetical protein